MKLFILTGVAAMLIAAPSAIASTVLRTGSSGPAVMRLQILLHDNVRRDYYAGNIDGVFGAITRSGLALWQKSQGFQPTGAVATGSRQWNLLVKQAVVNRLPAGIDPRAVASAKQAGWSIDASKHTAMLYLLRYDAPTKRVVVAYSTPTSFGGCNRDGCFVTPSGAFPVCRKAGPNEVSHEWKDSHGNWAAMPWAVYMYIGGRCSGTAVHYDPLGNSHQCVHVPSWPGAEYIKEHIPIGALVVIHG